MAIICGGVGITCRSRRKGRHGWISLGSDTKMEFRFETEISERRDEERTSSKTKFGQYFIYKRVCGNKLYRCSSKATEKIKKALTNYTY